MERRSVRFGGVVVAAVLVVAPLHAQDTLGPNAHPPPPGAPVSLDAGAHAWMLFGERCTRTGSDIEGCQNASILAGVHVAPAFHLTRHWAVGLRGAATFAGTGGRGDGLLTIWQVEAEGRYHFVNSARMDTWVGADAGIAVLAEHVENDELGPPATLTSTRAIFGFGAGLAFPIASVFRLGPEVRGVFLPSGKTPNDTVPRGTALASQAGLAVAITGTMLFGG